MARPARSAFGSSRCVGLRLSAAELREVDDVAELLGTKAGADTLRALLLEGVRSVRARARESVRAPEVSVVVGCGESKAGLGPDTPIPAGRLYCSTLFQKSLELGRRIAPSDVWIASAKHGAIRPETEIAEYDAKLSDDDADEWAARVSEVVASGRAAGIVVLLMGERYAAPLRVAFARRGWHVREPLKGKAIGRRLAFLKDELETR